MYNNLDSQIISCNMMIENVFSNIEKDSLQNTSRTFIAWKSILTRLKNNSGICIGEKLYANSSLVEIKNGILLIETTHPGFIQLFRIHEKFILNGFQRFCPEMEIKNLSFRIKGSSFTLKQKEIENENREKEYLNQKFEKEEKNIEKIYTDEKKSIKKEEIPDNLKNKLESIRKNMLTKSLNK